jgi:hypothetical protein
VAAPIHGPLDAGRFSVWLVSMEAALRGERDADVPCDGCTACCTSSQFVHIGPEEVDTLAHIDPALLFPAPRLPRGHVLLGFDDRGHCPMLVEGGCSIYEHRPRACRTYDCRVFAAAGVDPADDGKQAVADRVRRWRFVDDGPVDGPAQAAVRRAADHLRAHPDDVPGGPALTTTQLAVAAVELHRRFLD